MKFSGMPCGVSEWAAAGKNHGPKGARLAIPCPCLAACQGTSLTHVPEHWVAAPVSFHTLTFPHLPCLQRTPLPKSQVPCF